MAKWQLLVILLVCFVLLGCLLPQEKPAELPSTTAGGKVIAFNKSEQLTFTKAKVADYTYEIKNKAGVSVSVDKVVNRIDVSKNLLLDCGATVCDYKVEVTAKQALQFDTDTLKGAWQGEGVSVEKIFYSDIRSVVKTRPTYADALQEQCYQTVVNDTGENLTIVFENATKNITLCFNTTVQMQNGTETYYENESFENVNLTATFAKDEVRTYVIRFVKDSPSRNVDIYHTIFGQDRKDAAWWNGSVWFNNSFSYWISTNNDTAFANLTFNSTANTFYIYENGSVEHSNITTTMLFGDDFDGAVVDTNIWNITDAGVKTVSGGNVTFGAATSGNFNSMQSFYKAPAKGVALYAKL